MPYYLIGNIGNKLVNILSRNRQFFATFLSMGFIDWIWLGRGLEMSLRDSRLVFVTCFLFFMFLHERGRGW